MQDVAEPVPLFTRGAASNGYTTITRIPDNCTVDMSTEPSLDPELVAQTKQQIRSLVAEISQLSKAEVSPEEFYGEFLNRVVSALAATGGAVWTLNEEGRLALQYQINIQETKIRDDEKAQQQHGRLLYNALESNEGMLVPPHSGSAADDKAANPTDFLIVLGLLKTDLEVSGVVEVFQRPEAGPNTQKGYLRFLLQMCELAGEYLKSHQLRHFSDRQVMWTQLEDFTRVVHASLNPRDTAYTIANEGRRLIGCDRLSVAIRRGGKCKIEAISGQDTFDKRSNTVRLLGNLASSVVVTGEPVWYTGDTSDMAPQVEDAIEEYVDESHSKTVAVLPLMPPAEETDEDEEEEQAGTPTSVAPIGAIIVEQIEDSRVPQSMVQRVEVVSQHSATALGNSIEHQSLFLMPLWRALGKTRWILQARTLPKTILAVAAVIGVFAFLAMWPADFELESKGTLEPVERYDVFAGIDGVVTENGVKAKHGDFVRMGDVLVELRNTDLDIAMENINGEIASTKEKTLSINRRINEPGMTTVEQNRMEGERAVLNEQLNSLAEQKALYDKKREELQVKSPADGQILTWETNQRLDARPIQRGQVLMKVANPKGDWQLELQMPEDNMGHIVKALAKARKKDQDATLPVAFILRTDPGIEYTGLIKEIHLSAEVQGEEGSAVLIKVDIQKSKLIDENKTLELRPGAEVSAKVYCGRRSIGYVWLHDPIEFIQSRVLFKF